MQYQAGGRRRRANSFNTAVAEADPMSSTSNEVCELWNGREVVRCMGEAPVREFLVLSVPAERRQGSKTPIVTVMDFDDVIKKGYLRRRGQTQATHF